MGFVASLQDAEFKAYLELIRRKEHVQWMPRCGFCFNFFCFGRMCCHVNRCHFKRIFLDDRSCCWIFAVGDDASQ